MAVAAEVPARFDLVLNSVGYLLDRRIEPNAQHAYTPTFLPRQNITGSYGDNQQDFWLTLSQNDWSGGEQQKHILVNDAQSRSRYWRGSAVDVSTEGQATLQLDAISYSVSASVAASCTDQGVIAYVVGSDLLTVEHGRTAVSRGSVTSTLSGLTPYGMASDDKNVFIAYPTGGTNGCIRQWNGTSTFSDFAPSLGVSSTAFLNNVLYGAGRVSNGNMKLYSFSTSGVATTLYEWKCADGTAETQSNITRLRRFGNQLLILFSQHTPGRLMVYDGDSPTVLAELPHSFFATEVCENQGIVFVGGSYYQRKTTTSNATYYQLPAVFFYVDGRLSELWRADSWTASDYAIGDAKPAANPMPFRHGVLWWDSIRSQLTFYDTLSGAISGVSASSNAVGLGESTASFVWFNGPDASHAGQYPDPTTYVSSGYVATSLFDGDSSLPKYWKSVKVDADIPSGATMDISYLVNDLSVSYTSAQTSAVAGTEYALGVSGRSISIKVTLNKGSSTSGPILKRIYVRGMPLLDTFRRDTYVVDCGGLDAADPVMLRDGTASVSSGLQLATALRTASLATAPFNVTDEFGTYTGLIEPDSLRIERMSDREFRATFTVRQV